jgi:tripartite ATP-independent transporter DctP family solute receptor
MRLNRRTMLRAGTAALAAPLLPRYARAAEYSWKIAHTAPTSFPLHIRLVEVAAAVKKESNGRMELQVFPDGQLGGDNDLLSQARSGAIEMCQPTGQIMGSILPQAAINGLGFAWSGYDKVWPAMDGDLGKYVRGQIAAKTGLVAMDRMWDLGFRNITSGVKPIRNAADLVGFKIRVPVAPTLVTLFQTLKAAPLALQFTELYSALQTHIADGQENPLTLIKVAKLYEVQKYCSITRHVWDGHWWVANAVAWKGLPDDLKDIVARNLNEGALRERADMEANEKTAQVWLEQNGMVFNVAETQSFRDGLTEGGFYKLWRGKLGDEPFEILQRYAGKLG